jgi:hypothetical protein
MSINSDRPASGPLSVLLPMVSGPITVDLVPQSGHFVPEENPAFVITSLRCFIDTDC